ncbi:metal ABC transporter solute-binding protein, Zn/Mn family [Streptococcus ruminantium]|uniref:metal ABC transporter solute-binding protein, Zn/Mn family n=1 Tax=Streptococcus ruminantium TaxID=1917441 RepID=UPI0012DEF054|nr:zinc ABC transporter substrate-binding protein [Streptococcus ruminantium]
MLKKIIKPFLLTLVGLVLASCSVQKGVNQTQTGLKIVTSFYPIYSLVKEVSGDKNDVRMIGSRSGIHSYEPSAADIKAIHDADVFIYHSRILESWAGRLGSNLQGSSVKVLEASTNLPLAKVPGLEDMEAGQGIDEATLYDPHTWLDPILAGQEALEIGDLLAKSDPTNAEYYKKNAEKLKEAAQKLADKYSPIFAKAKSKTFVTQHTAFSYTAQRFGLKQLGIAGVSEEEPSPRKLAEIKEFVDTYKVKTIFTEKGSSDKLAKALASSTGVSLKILDPLEADPENNLSYLENLEKVLETLAQELK